MEQCREERDRGISDAPAVTQGGRGSLYEVKMRVLYLHQYFRTPRMPGGTRSYEIARRLVARGHEVRIVTSDQSADRSDVYYTVESGIKVAWLPVAYSNRMPFWRRNVAFLDFLVRASSMSLEWRPDVVFATSTPLTIGIPALVASKHWSVPMVFEVRDLWPEVPIAMGALRNPVAIWLARRLERACYEGASHVVALSPGMKSGIERTGWIDGGRVSVVPNLSNPEMARVKESAVELLREKLQIPATGPMVLYAGTIGKVNDVAYLVRLARESLVRGASLSFVVVGDGNEREKVVEEAERVGVLGRNFHIRDRIVKEEMPALLALSDMAVSTVADIPALFHNSANKFFDALAAGVPVGVNYGGWQADLIREEGVGIVLSRNPDEALGQLLAFFADEEKVQLARTRAREVAERFSADRAALIIESILERAVSERNMGAIYSVASECVEWDGDGCDPERKGRK